LAESKSEKPKIYVPDTNVLILDAEAINNFKEHDVYLHGAVLEELDNLKRKSGTEHDARQAIGHVDNYAERGWFSEGVPTPGGGKLFVNFTLDEEFSSLPVGLEKNNDNRIILLAKRLQKEYPDRQVVFVTNDIKPRATANACKILAEPYKHGRVDKLYSGARTINLDDKAADLIDALYRNKSISAKEIFSASTKVRRGSLFPNQCCYLNAGEKFALAVYEKNADTFALVQWSKGKTHTKIVPKDAEQHFAYHLLTNKKIDLVTLAGPAGTGKTLVAVWAGYEQLENGYDQMLIFRPTYELGKPMGFLKGYLDQKFEPWTIPIIDAFERMLDLDKLPKGSGDKKNRQGIRNWIKDYIDMGLLEILPINYIQGRNLHKKFVIVDETQNFTKEEMKMIITRAGEGTKMVLTGDPEQVANPFIDERSNGLTQVINEFKNCENYGHITMTKTKRSRLAEWAAKLL